ncbi:MAG: hypothetical protein SGPRY_006086, partial [Prymnesium sp.]
RQVSHVQPDALDGDQIRAESDDWGEFQLRTTKGWGAMNGALGCVPFLFLNLQASTTCDPLRNSHPST